MRRAQEEGHAAPLEHPLAFGLEPCCPGNDLWLIDGRLMLFHWFTGVGEWAGHEFNEDSATVKMVIAAFEAVWERAIPHEEFTT
ncbi:DUF6879 family protein [Streptomyces filamentosus]|uniref:DUF6879 family protein n=1 Tax=Streptomyces TaxID=1883 RepID=UPI0035714B6F